MDESRESACNSRQYITLEGIQLSRLKPQAVLIAPSVDSPFQQVNHRDSNLPHLIVTDCAPEINLCRCFAESIQLNVRSASHLGLEPVSPISASGPPRHGKSKQKRKARACRRHMQ